MRIRMRSALVRRVREQDRRIEAVASTEQIDSYSTILRCNWDLARFLANPVLLFVHNDHSLPVGRCENVRVEGKELLFDAVFDDVTELDKQVWEKYRRGTMRGFSVRFNPLEQRTIKEGDRDVVEYTRSELVEISCAPVPANPAALRRSAGEGDMRKRDLMKGLKAMAEGDGDEDEKKSARAAYEAMGGDECMKALDDAEGGEDQRADEEEPPPESKPPERSAGQAAPKTPYEDPARAASKRAASPLEVSVANLLVRVDAFEKRTAAQEVSEVLAGRPDLAPSVVKELRALGDPATVRRIVQAMPKAELRAAKTAPATRGEDQGAKKAPATAEEGKIDKVLGIRAKATAAGFSPPDPDTGMRAFSTLTPSEARAQAAGKAV